MCCCLLRGIRCHTPVNLARLVPGDLSLSLSLSPISYLLSPISHLPFPISYLLSLSLSLYIYIER